jgi:hypothetical protein
MTLLFILLAVIVFAIAGFLVCAVALARTATQMFKRK